MKDTAGNEIYTRPICDCGLTGGCDKCMPKSVTITIPAVFKKEKGGLNNKICRACKKAFHWCASCGTLEDLEEELCPDCCEKLGIGSRGISKDLYRSL